MCAHQALSGELKKPLADPVLAVMLLTQLFDLWRNRTRDPFSFPHLAGAASPQALTEARRLLQACALLASSSGDTTAQHLLKGGSQI